MVPSSYQIAFDIFWHQANIVQTCLTFFYSFSFQYKSGNWLYKQATTIRLNFNWTFKSWDQMTWKTPHVSPGLLAESTRALWRTPPPVRDLLVESTCKSGTYMWSPPVSPVQWYGPFDCSHFTRLQCIKGLPGVMLTLRYSWTLGLLRTFSGLRYSWEY